MESYFKERFVSASNLRKVAPVELFAAVNRLDIEENPDGLKEDRAEVIQHKVALDV